MLSRAGDNAGRSPHDRDPRPVLLFFHSRRCGLSRRTDAHLAHELQRHGNHSTFRIRRIDVDERPELAERLGVRATPVLCVVVERRVVARLDVPKTSRQVSVLLAPWLRGARQPAAA